MSYLELLRVPYTGCNPRGLMLSRDKGLGKKVLAYHRVRGPDFGVFPIGRKVKRRPSLTFALIVKSLSEDASLGISQASVVDSDDKLAERVAFIHDSGGTAAIAEQYIEANPNPDIGYGAELPESAEKAGLPYERFLQRVLTLGLRWRLDMHR